jgi:hypothetical protein
MRYKEAGDTEGVILNEHRNDRLPVERSMIYLTRIFSIEIWGETALLAFWLNSLRFVSP